MSLARALSTMFGALVAAAAIEGAGFAQSEEEEPGGPRPVPSEQESEQDPKQEPEQVPDELPEVEPPAPPPSSRSEPELERREPGYAPSHRLTVRHVDRPMTLPARTLAIEGAFTTIGLTVFNETRTVKGIAMGVTFGATDNLTLSLVPLVLVLDPESEYGNPVVAGLYRFLAGNVEVGGGIQIIPKIQDNTSTRLVVGIPVLIHGPSLSFRTGMELLFEFREPKTVTSPIFPVAFGLQVADAFALQISSGLVLPDGKFDLAQIPLGASLAAAIPGSNGPALDLGVDFSFPAFLTPGLEREKVHTDLWTLNFFARAFVFL